MYLARLREEVGEMVRLQNQQQEQQPDRQTEALGVDQSTQYKLMGYLWELSHVMYCQGLLDKQEFLQWMLEIVEKSRDPEEPMFRDLMQHLNKFQGEFVKNELLARKLSYQCCKKINIMMTDTDAWYANQEPNNPAYKDRVIMIPGSSSPLPHQLAALLELQRDKDWNRLTIMTLSGILHAVVLECPTALVWHPQPPDKAPTSLLGSPLDHLSAGEVGPHILPSPLRADTADLRTRLKSMVGGIHDRAARVYEHWATSGPPDQANSSEGAVGKVLAVLEELDRFVFDRSDSSNCLDQLHSRLWPEPCPGAGVQGGVPTLLPGDEAVVMTLCEWATTHNRSGEHRAFVAAKLLEMRQTDMLSPDTQVEEEGGEQQQQQENKESTYLCIIHLAVKFQKPLHEPFANVATSIW